MNQANNQVKTGLIVEDQPNSMTWLSTSLSLAFPDIQITGTTTVAEAKKYLEQYTPDIAMIDLGLPDGSGIEIIKKIHAQDNSQTLSIVVSIFDDDKHLFKALQAGAAGYILKEQSQQQLIDMLHAINQGQPPLSPRIAKRLLGFFKDLPTPSEKDSISTLTKREIDVLTLIAKGYTIKKCAELLGITRNTTAGYVKNIYKKLNVSTRAEATIEAQKQGLLSIDNS